MTSTQHGLNDPEMPLSETAGGHLSHDEVANAVRMLTRHDLNHEMVCVTARDRIKWLATQNAAMLSALRRVSDFLAVKLDDGQACILEDEVNAILSQIDGDAE